MPKIIVSPEWTTEERAAVMTLVDASAGATVDEIVSARLTCLWQSPYILSLEARLGDLRVQRAFLDDASPAVLELNRRNFSEFVA